MGYGDSLYLNDQNHRPLEQRALHSSEGINEINPIDHEDILGRTTNRRINVLHEDSPWDWKDSALFVGGLVIYSIVGYAIYLNSFYGE